MKNKDLLFLLTLLSAFAEADGANMYARNIRSMNFVPKTNTQTMISNYLSRQNDIPTVVSDDSSVQGNSDVWNFSDYESLDGSVFWVDRTYKVARISYYDKSGSHVEIPAHITLSNEEYTVVGIGDSYSPIVNADSLVSVKLPETLRFIGSYCFSGCRKLESVEIPQYVDSIGERAFQMCDSLQFVKFPKLLNRIGAYAFSSCGSLKKADFSDVADNHIVVDEYAFQECNTLESLCSPVSFSSIGRGAFSRCYALKSIEFSPALRSIGESAFYSCDSLESLTFSEGLSIVGEGAFEGCSRLQSVIFSSGLTSIGNAAFRTCKSLKSVSFSEGAYSIGEGAFGNCESLESVHFTEGLSFLAGDAFLNCSSLQSVNLPASLSMIGSRCFFGCTQLKQVSIPESSVLTEIGSNAFHQTDLDEFVLPASLTTIGDHIVSSVKESGIKLTMQASVPPVLSSALGSNIYSVRVPQGASEAYRTAKYWKDFVIVEGDGVNLSINVDVPGTLGDKILAQTENLADVNRLTVTGTLNEEDIYSIKNRLPNLLEIDLAGVNMPVMNSELFINRTVLEKIILPKNLKEISAHALESCVSLENIHFPDSLRKIGINALYNCKKIKEIIVPEGVSVIENSAFYGCSGLEVLHLPSTLKIVANSLAYLCKRLTDLSLPNGIEKIESYAFNWASNLSTVTLPSTLMKLEPEAFGNCITLKHIVLPEKLISCANAFAGCSNLKEVTSLALFPPYLNDESLLGGGSTDYEDRKLYVPALNINDYKLTKGWDQFPTILGINELPQNINVYKPSEFELPDTLSKNYKPNLSLLENEFVYNQDCGYGYASLKVSGNPTLSLGKFDMVYNPYSYYNKYAANSPCYNALINEANMRADSVQITLYNASNRWHFLSFPYDVKVSDIMPLYENTNWVIRKYSGASRAAQDMDKTWQNMTADSTLQAGVGYIWQSTCPESYCGFVVPALNNAQKNLIFANDTRSIALEEHLSEFAHNRSWNLIGNPFPSFYDIRFIDFTAPITVWNDNNSTYEAYSPLDDEYILRPGEAFFVQRPVDKATIEFAPEGRQTTRLVREMPESIVARAQGRGLQVERQVFNIELSNGETTDRTRFVLNEDASRDYDLATDAGKFMSPDASVSQLYTIENGVSLSINERPLDDGMIALGAYFGRKGSYTISLNTRADAQVYLIDNLTGAETDLTMQDYTFNAEAGTVNDRFVIVVKKEGTTTGLSNNMSVAKVTAVSGQILVQAPQSADIAVYATDGKIVGKSQGTEASFSVRPGVYVVIINGTSYKVTVTE